MTRKEASKHYYYYWTPSSLLSLSPFRVLNFWYSPWLSLILEQIPNHRKKGREIVHQNMTLGVHALIHSTVITETGSHSAYVLKVGNIQRHQIWGVGEREKSKITRSTWSSSCEKKKDVKLETPSTECEETCTREKFESNGEPLKSWEQRSADLNRSLSAEEPVEILTYYSGNIPGVELR